VRFGLLIEQSSEYVYPSQGRSTVLWGNMSRLSLTCLMAFLSATGAGLAVDAVRNSAIPVFATDDTTGWQLDRTFGVDDLIAVPGGGPGGPSPSIKPILTCHPVAGFQPTASPISPIRFCRTGRSRR